MNIGVLDVETTGLDYTKDKITEVGLIIYDADAALPIWSYGSLNDPKMDIDPTVVALNGITNELCHKQKVDFGLLDKKAASCTYLIAHNAIFDMQFIFAETGNRGGFAPGKWLCSQYLVDWTEIPGVRGSQRQAHIGADLGIFNTFPHRAVFDAATLGRMIFQTGVLDQMIKKARSKWYFVAALNAPFNKKDLLKERGYKPYFKRTKYNVPIGDGKFEQKEKAEFGFWYTIVPEYNDGALNEKHFLLDEVYPRMPNLKDSNKIIVGQSLPFEVREYEHWYQPLMYVHLLENPKDLEAKEGKENGK
jgi:DNA polymerase-3 subunit epsilon